MGVGSHVNTRPLLRGIQQTLPDIDWNTEPLCKSLVVFLLVVVTDILECIVQSSVASAATTTKSSVLNLTIAVSQLLFFLSFGSLGVFSVFNKKECFLHFSGHRGENTSAAFAVITSPRADKCWKPRPPCGRRNKERITGRCALWCALSDCYLYFAVI